MWTLTDIDALPSSDEVVYAKLAIVELKILLKGAVGVAEQAKSRKEIKVRRAWLAPIRKLPVEILSEIFLISSQMRRLMPVTIAEVCRSWRMIILSMPRAWSVIDHQYSSTGDDIPLYVSTFIQWSDPCTIHVRAALRENHRDNFGEKYGEDHTLRALGPAAHRIECLAIPYGPLERMGDTAFSKLTKLSLIGNAYRIIPSYFTRSRFPSLRYFDSGGCFWGMPTDANQLWSPLDYLIIDGDDEGAYVEVLKGVCITLKGLEVESLPTAWESAPVSVHFPILKYMKLNTWKTYHAWPIQATTPALLSYEESTGKSLAQSILHKDVENVVCFRSWDLPQIHSFVAMRVLQLSGSPSLLGLTEYLQYHKDACPALQAIEILSDMRLTVEQRDEIGRIMKDARPHVEISYPRRWSTIPGMRRGFECGHAIWDET